MGKILNSRTSIVVLALLACILLALLIRVSLYEREIQASIVLEQTPEGTLVEYADSTKSAGRWRWDFGNGDPEHNRPDDYSTSRAGKFLYIADTVFQRYQIRLRVDGKLEKKFIVEVPAKRKQQESDQLIRIKAPATGIEGEYIVFRGEGNSKEWRWEFGESGMIDAREKTAIYRYERYGTYEVLLETEETKYPVRHAIVIEPQYSDDDTLDVASMIGNEIKIKLQAIVDRKPFNENYNYILKTYLCNNPNTPVIINNSKKNDFYSYCQGLRIVGRKKTLIDKVLIDMEKEGNYCITKLIVLQTDLE
ncbi:MAG: PKD domain-containing protein [Dysgonamonadaceae bacterium]|jgi:hypothetical protein|nr:PKD domain-containing protein [Dysgonamonadaceae bacterium]